MESLWKSSRAIKVSDEQFSKDLEQYGTLELAKVYGVSKNTISDKRRQLGIKSKYGTGTSYVISDDVATFTTTKGLTFIVDSSDAELICSYRWYIGKNGYIIYDSPDKKSILLHRFLMNPDSKEYVDHINRVTTDCRRSNMRVVVPSQNSMNKSNDSRSTTGHKGVHWAKRLNKWQSHISAYGVRYHLGTFGNIEDAVKARKEAELKYFGEFNG